jgi:hypothetical protein
MGCMYWECKYNNLSKKDEMGDCGKSNGSYIKHPCPEPNQLGNFCSEGESRNTQQHSYSGTS